MPPIEEVLRENLTDQQYDAATDVSNEILCLACAGSGKSRTLAFRIARLIAEGTEPKGIVAFTFTDKAAESIKRRVADALSKAGLPVAMVGAMYIGTIHSYCQRLLMEIDAKYGQYDVLDDNKLKLYLLSRYAHLDLISIRNEKNARQFQTIDEVSKAWKMSNDEMLSFDNISEYAPTLGGILSALRERLERDEFIDFSLMIRLAVEALENNDQRVVNALADVKHLMVDEYQDVNPSQERLIAGLYQHLETLFVVGDDDQSIYGWRGADVRNIIEFDQRYPNCSPHTLETNFRSTNAIVEAADAFIQAELAASRINKNPRSNSDGNIRHFRNVWFDTREDEANWVAQRIQSLLGTKYIEDDGTERGLTKSDFAILMRSVKSGNPPYHTQFTNALRNLGIEYTIEAEGGIFERPHAVVLRSTMELLRNVGPSRKSVRELFDAEILPNFPQANFSSIVDVISQWNIKIHTPAGGARRKVYPQELVHDLLDAFGVPQTDFSDVVLRDLGVFSSIILDVEKVFVSIDDHWRYTNVLNFLSNVAESGYDVSSLDLTNRPDTVTISTVHKMKGLEYPVVFVVDLVNQRFPMNNSSYRGWLPVEVLGDSLARGLYQTSVFSEARLFYTAITRAERILYLTGSASHPNLKTDKKSSRFKNRLQHEELTDISDDLPEGLQIVREVRRIDENHMPTSFTEIKDYLTCPMKYKFRKIYGFSPAVPELFGFGLTTHTAINKLHQTYQNQIPTVDQAQGMVEENFHLKHVFPSNDPENRPGSYENAKNRSSEIVSRYVDEYPQDFAQSRQVEVNFDIKADKALITGAIDLLLKEDDAGKILEAAVIDFKSMDFPDENVEHFWINLSLQVQLYAHASKNVLGENAKTGAVHLLKALNNPDQPNRVEVPISDEAIDSAIKNIEWAVDRILDGQFPKRPSEVKCANCDFAQLCSRTREEFMGDSTPPSIHIPSDDGNVEVMIRAFSDLD